MKRYLWMILAAPAILGAQSASGVATPTLGYLFDPEAQTLRAIEGVPGAAVLGDALHLGSPSDGEMRFDAIRVAPNRRYALAVRSGETTLRIVRLDGRSGSARSSSLAAGRSYFSPAGNSVAVVTDESIEVWTGLPDEPSLQRTVSAGMAVDAAFLSDNGRELAVLSKGTLWAFGEERRALATDVSDAAFLRGTQDLVALTATGANVYRKSDPGTAEPLLRLEGGTALALARDEHSLAVLSAQGITWAERDSEARVTLALEGASQLSRAEGNSVFQLVDADGNVWILDGDTGAPRLLSVEIRGVEIGGGQAQ